MSHVNVPVQDGFDFQEFKAQMEGFAAGAAAAAEHAIQIRLAQLSKGVDGPAPPAAEES